MSLGGQDYKVKYVDKSNTLRYNMLESREGDNAQMKRFDGTEIAEQDAARFKVLVDSHRWIFAKTYAAFCPHEYTLTREWKNRADFDWFAKFIRDNGFDAYFGKSGAKRYFIDEDGGWYYFVVPEDFDDNGEVVRGIFGINRGSLGQWELVEESDMFGTQYRWKRLPKERRKPVN